MSQHAVIGPRPARPPSRAARLQRVPRFTAIEPLESRLLMAADMIVYWNNVLISAIRADRTDPGPGWSSRNMAIVQAAVFDAVNAVDGSCKSYLIDVPS